MSSRSDGEIGIIQAVCVVSGDIGETYKLISYVNIGTARETQHSSARARIDLEIFMGN